jgi:hypothetical protein
MVELVVGGDGRLGSDAFPAGGLLILASYLTTTLGLLISFLLDACQPAIKAKGGLPKVVRVACSCIIPRYLRWGKSGAVLGVGVGVAFGTYGVWLNPSNFSSLRNPNNIWGSQVVGSCLIYSKSCSNLGGLQATGM